MRLLSVHLREGPRPVDFPVEGLAQEGPPRGVPFIDPGLCTGCGGCIEVCPAGCLTIVDGEGPGRVPLVDAGPCVRCGICVATCGEDAVWMTGSTDMAAYTRRDLLMDGRPPGERTLGRPPSRLFRWTMDEAHRRMVRPPDLMEERSRNLRAEERDR